MGSGWCNSERIMADIYESQNNVLLQTGLGDAINKDDFMAKCESLGQIWGNSVPGLHTWFKRKKASFFIEFARGNAENFCSWKCWYRESILYEWSLAKTQASEK